MTLQQLIYFREVARTKHFTRAAENVYMAQSSLSHAIQELEHEIGAPLFLRKNGKKICLTRYGEAFLPHVERALNEIDKGREELIQMITPNSGIVTIIYTYVNGCSTVPQMVNAFSRNPDNKDIELKFIINHSGFAVIEEALSTCKADLAISCSPFRDSKHVQAIKLGKQELLLTVPACHPLAEKDMVRLKDIKDDNIIMFSNSMNLYGHVVSMFEEEGIKPHYVDGISDWTAVLMEVARGRGVTILPEIDMASKNVRQIRIDHPNNSRTTYMLWQTDRKLSAAAEKVRDFCIEFFKGENL